MHRLILPATPFTTCFLIAAALVLCVCVQNTVQAQGVAVADGVSEHYLHLDANHVLVNVEDQVAVVTSTQRFENTSSDSTRFTFAFPLAEDASPIGIRWFINNVWYRGIIEAVRPDTTLPGGGGGGEDASELRNYLGETPFYFDIDQLLAPDASVIVELQYVQLLPYSFGNVDFEFPNTYAAIQAGPIGEQTFQFNLSSQRSIDDITMLSHPGFTTENLGNKATTMLDRSEQAMDTHYHVRYSLSQQELGLFGFSTLLVDSLVADERAGGFFTFVVEPDPNDNGNVIEKVFTLIIDRSGSMQGDKIVQARDAASFIVNNLNEGDRFNIVDFSSSANNFRPEHVLFNEDNKQAALNYISGLNSGGGTNIADALTGAISQFEAADANTANLIVFFTDGEATIGVEDTPGILALVESAVAQAETNPVLYTFGIGTSVDTQLLTLLAANNGGLSAFLGNDELESRITEFYLGIRNPVLLNTSLAFDQAGITDVVPFPLPSLYKGQQMIVSGRYLQPGPVNITLSGNAFGSPIDYTYTLNLADSTVTRYQFLTKVWAKQKIEQLLVSYYSLKPSTDEAKLLREEVTELSISFGIITPFTSFQGGEEDDVSVGVEEEEPGVLPTASDDVLQIQGNYPNPFATSTRIKIQIGQVLSPEVSIRIYDSLGRLVRTLTLHVSHPGVYEIEWDGLSDAGIPVSAGAYIVVAEYEHVIWSHVVSVVR